MTYLVSELC